MLVLRKQDCIESSVVDDYSNMNTSKLFSYRNAYKDIHNDLILSSVFI